MCFKILTQLVFLLIFSFAAVTNFKTGQGNIFLCHEVILLLDSGHDFDRVVLRITDQFI